MPFVVQPTAAVRRSPSHDFLKYCPCINGMVRVIEAGCRTFPLDCCTKHGSRPCALVLSYIHRVHQVTIFAQTIRLRQAPFFDRISSVVRCPALARYCHPPPSCMCLLRKAGAWDVRERNEQERGELLCSSLGGCTSSPKRPCKTVGLGKPHGTSLRCECLD